MSEAIRIISITTRVSRGDQARPLDLGCDDDTQATIEIELVSQQMEGLLQRTSYDQTVGSA
jgi:hypothetical protein